MPEFTRLTRLDEIDALDSAEVYAGYVAGLRGEPEPIASVFSRSYWHGWRNGAVDGGHRETDAAQQHLARLYQEVGCYTAPH